VTKDKSHESNRDGLSQTVTKAPWIYGTALALKTVVTADAGYRKEIFVTRWKSAGRDVQNDG
jgi:hypothetical protein